MLPKQHKFKMHCTYFFNNWTNSIRNLVLFSFIILLDSRLEHAGAISLEENGPRFMDDWTSSVKFSSRVGGKLFCRAHGQPRPTIQWFSQDFLPVTNISSIREVDEDGTLHFHIFDTNSFRADVHSTNYRCRASNQVGSILSPEIQLRAVVDLSYEIENQDVTVLRGNVAILRCSVPQQVKDFISITSWVQDSTLNIYPSFQSGKYLLLPNGDLYVFNVDSSDAYKNFACRTSNKLTNEGKTSSPSRIIVKESEVTDPVPVKLIVPKQLMVKAKEGEDVYLPCGASGHPPPEYLWYREQDEVLHAISASAGPQKSGSNSHSYHPFPAGPILLSQVKLADAGIYVCWVNNSISQETVRAQVNVYVPLQAQIGPRSQIIDVGRSATFRCTASGHPIQSIEWLKDGKRIGQGTSTASRYGSSTAPDTLVILSVHPTDSGMYQCFARNDLYSSQDSAQLRLGSVVPELIYRFTEQTMQPGPSVSLKCTAVGNPPPQFTWTLDGYSLPESERFMVGQYVTIHDNVISHVNITNVRDEDGGLVTCEAKNSMGIVSHSARLNIYGPPFVRPIPAVKAVAGKNLQIQCPVSGWPIDGISWERGGTVLPVNRRQKVYSNGTLIIEQIHRGEDEGIYGCTARNRQGLVSMRDLHLQVVVAPKIMPFQFMSQLLKEGMRAAVSCQVIEGDKPFDFTWHFNNKPIVGSHIPGHQSGLRVLFPDEYSSTLVIESLESVHSGEYECIVENSAGREIHSAQLTVNVPPKWTLEPRDINVSSGQSIALHCQASGYPTPSILWKRAMGIHPGDYKDLSSNSVESYGNGTVRFHEVRKTHEGSYLCEARNGVGTGLSKVIFVKVNAPAQFVDRDHQQVSVRVLEKAILQCRAVGDLPIEIQWSNKHSKISSQTHRYMVRHQTIEDTVMSELLISDVTRDDGGIYFCRAGNMFGSDQTSIVLNVQEPPGQPVNIRLMEQQSRSVHISWSDTFNGNSPLLKYVIQYKFPSDTWSPDEILELSVPASQTNVKLEPLSPATTYYIRILAQNNIGYGPPSEMIQVTTGEEAPDGSPTGVQIEPISSTKLKIEWAPPEKKFWHGTILGYYLGYRELGSALLGSGSSGAGAGSSGIDEHGNHLGIGSSGFNFNSLSNAEMNGFHFRTVEVGIDFGGTAVLENLNRYTRYIVIVQAFNSQGHGPASIPSVGLTMQDVPSMSPDSITCLPISSQGLQITWQDPPLEGRHGLIQGYKIKYQILAEDGESGSSSASEEETTPENNNVKMVMSKSTTLHGLKKWTNYSINILAFTSVGDGIFSKSFTCQTDEDVSSPPSNIKALVSSRHSIHISWLPPDKPNGLIQNYTLYMKSADSAKIEKKHFQSHERSYAVVNLKENQKYEFWMSASTRVGEGGPTSRVRAATTTKIQAKITSFSQTVQIPWKRNVILPCDTIGIPEPSIFWKLNGNNIELGARKHINGIGTLTLQEVSLDDGGNYSCTTSNPHGSDTIVYWVKVQVPPLPPLLVVTESFYDSLQLSWTLENDGGSWVKGYMIHYKKSDGGDWEELEIEGSVSVSGSSGSTAPVLPNSKSNSVRRHILKGLTCGSKYQLYITAFNKIGTGHPSQIVTTETKGNSPTPPRRADLLSTGNSSSITIKLESWIVVGCPIIRFIVEYREMLQLSSSLTESSSSNWIRLPNDFSGDTKYCYIKELSPNTKYAVRITAENHAGKSTANYNFQTAPTSPSSTFHDGAGLISDSELESSPGESQQSTLSTSLLIVFPSILSFIAMAGVIVVLCYFRRKRLVFGPKTVLGDSSSGLHLDTQTLGNRTHEPRYCPVKTNEPVDGDHAMRYKAVDSAGYVEDVCPYATFQLPDKAPGRPMLIGKGNSKKKLQRGSSHPQQQQQQQQPPQQQHHHTGDTMYTTGNIYSGPYHSVQSAGFHYNQAATMQMREPEYSRVRNPGSRHGPHGQHGQLEIESQESDNNLASTDSEVKKILTLHMPITEYDTLGSDSDEEAEGAEKYHQSTTTPSHKHKSCHHHHQHHTQQQQHRPSLPNPPTMIGSRQYNLPPNQGQLPGGGQDPGPTPFQQEMVTFRQKTRSDPVMTSEPESSTSSDDHSPRKNHHHHTNSYFSRKNKSKSKSSVQSGSSSAKQRVRSSSGYSSHTEETSFSFYDRIQPPTRFSDSRDLSDDIDQDGCCDEPEDYNESKLSKTNPNPNARTTTTAVNNIRKLSTELYNYAISSSSNPGGVVVGEDDKTNTNVNTASTNAATASAKATPKSMPKQRKLGPRDAGYHIHV